MLPPSPRFPPEIENLMFEQAARLNPNDAPTLSIVSKRIQACVEHVIYESLYISPFPPGQHASRNACDERIHTFCSRRAEFFAANVSNLYIAFGVPLDITERILPKCTTIRRLAFFGTSIVEYSRGLIPSTLTLSWLYIDKHSLHEMIKCGIALPNLSFLGFDCLPMMSLVPPLDSFPALETVQLELILNWELRGEDIMTNVETALRTPPQLRVLRLGLFADDASDVNALKKHIAESDIVSHGVAIEFRRGEIDFLKIWKTSLETQYYYTLMTPEAII